MAWAISHWESDSLDWLQHGQCSGTCSSVDSWTTLKNMSFRTADATPPEPVDTTVYKYGNKCDDNLDQSECGEDCLHCQFSWPADDPANWQSENAACRCLPMQRASLGYTYSANPCATSSEGICGDNCSECNFSWPSDDPS